MPRTFGLAATPSTVKSGGGGGVGVRDSIRSRLHVTNRRDHKWTRRACVNSIRPHPSVPCVGKCGPMWKVLYGTCGHNVVTPVTHSGVILLAEPKGLSNAGLEGGDGRGDIRSALLSPLPHPHLLRLALPPPRLPLLPLHTLPQQSLLHRGKPDEGGGSMRGGAMRWGMRPGGGQKSLLHRGKPG